MNPLQTIINLEMDIRSELFFAKSTHRGYRNTKQIMRLERMLREVGRLRDFLEAPVGMSGQIVFTQGERA